MVIIFGFLAAAFALIAELLVFSLFTFSESASVTPLPIGGAELSFSVLLTLLLGALIEEASKYLFLLRYRIIRIREETLSFLQTALTGLLFGLGFSLPEAWFAWDTIGLKAAPITGIVLVHAVTSILLAAALLDPSSRLRPRIAYILATIIHIAYNIAAYLIFPAY